MYTCGIVFVPAVKIGCAYLCWVISEWLEYQGPWWIIRTLTLFFYGLRRWQVWTVCHYSILAILITVLYLSSNVTINHTTRQHHIELQKKTSQFLNYSFLLPALLALPFPFPLPLPLPLPLLSPSSSSSTDAASTGTPFHAASLIRPSTKTESLSRGPPAREILTMASLMVNDQISSQKR